jgi:hypothetical protein
VRLGVAYSVISIGLRTRNREIGRLHLRIKVPLISDLPTFEALPE